MTVTSALGFGIASVFIGCQINVLSLEQFVQHPAGKAFGNALTFLQFVAVSLFALVLMLRRTPRARFPISLRPLVLAPRYIVTLALLHYSMSVVNNMVFSFDISVPLHAVFRSSSLIATMLVGYLARGQRFSAAQTACALLVTTGVIGLTIATARQRQDEPQVALSSQESVWWWFGIFLLFLTTATTSVMSTMQDAMFADARKRVTLEQQRDLWRESLLVTHAVPIPLFVAINFLSDNPLLGGGLFRQIIDLPSSLWPAVLVNVLSQCICVRGVSAIVANSSGVTLQLTLTLRKFLSLVVSIYTFGHYARFGFPHYAALLAATVGGSLYPFLKKPVVANAPVTSRPPAATSGSKKKR
jgi:UDP-xylose/UDP-N-acetylglucosamine transporter B4